jgi:4-carboxymuconolactone decarboxylase
MARLTMPLAEDLTPEQAEVVSEVIAGKRGKVPVPMIGWLANPEFARRAQKLGELLRFDTSLEPGLSELAILVCGRHWTSHYEWTAHKRIAIEAGVDPRTIAGIAARDPAPFTRGPREAVVHSVATALMKRGKIDNALYARAIEVLGEKAMVELVGILGYYSLVALTLNAFEIGLPEHLAPELQSEGG